MGFLTKVRTLLERPVIRHPKYIEIKKSPLHGRGVFAKKNCKAGTILEIAPVILLSAEEREFLRYTMLFDYYFVVDNGDFSGAMGLGASSLYNHSQEANAAYSISIKKQSITIRACKPIRLGEEITLNYNGRPDDSSPVYLAEQDPEPAGYPELSDPGKSEKELYIKEVPGKGRAVFCNRSIAAGSTIESSILLVFPPQDFPTISQTRLTDYIFNFDKDQQLTALALGFGSLYNHALYPNAAYDIDHADRMIRYYATENIKKGMEICINYDGSSGSEEWFKARNISASL